MTTAAVAETNEVRTEDLRAATVKAGTTLIQETTKLMTSLDTSDEQSLTHASALLTAGLAGLQGKTSTNEAPSATDVEVQKLAFLEKFGIQVIGESKVSFTLPKGASVLDLLNDAQALARGLHNQDAISSELLNTCSYVEAFSSKVSKPSEISIDGNVSGSTGKTRDQQVELLKEQGLAMASIEHLAAAHVAYFIATGKDLFEDNMVRARGGVLDFGGDGLSVYDGLSDSEFSDGYRYASLAASASLAPRN